MMRYVVAVLIIGVVALAAASEPEPPKKSVKSVKSGYAAKSGYAHAPAHAPGYGFYGIYPGKCGNDGLYYNDPFSFVVCTNGNAYVQRCAPGTQNSGYGNFKVGSHYGYTDFCDINLNDYAHAAAPAKSGYHAGYAGHAGPYYGGPYYGGYPFPYHYPW